jgi:coenzyme PQQ precursor peptide PqqA
MVHLKHEQGARRRLRIPPHQMMEVSPMTWSKPEFTELRFGFEVTMYIWSR